jgi:glycosyltransferase involved in cell wall biosynthesis
MQVTISAASLFWAHRAAQVAQEHGHLRYWITGAPDHKKRGVEPARIRYVLPPAYLRYGMERVLPGNWGQFTATVAGDNLFDLLASRYAADCDIFHVYNHHGLISMRRAAKHGAKTIVERASAHILTQHNLLREEFARHDMRFPDARWPMEWKHVQEYEEADHIIVVSEFVKRTMVERGIPADKMTVIGLGADLETFKPQPKQDDVFRVLFVGASSLQKGTHYLLEAFSKLQIPNSELVLVGGVFPEMEPVMRQYEGTHRFVPGVPQHELVALYNSASVFVIPSIQDGQPMAAFEAMACGVPVIISDNVGTPIQDGQEGFVVPIRDPESIAERLIYLYENESERHAMGQKAQTFAQQFTWDAYQRRLLALYGRLADLA